MREQFRSRLYDFVYVTGKIDRFGHMKFDGHETILRENPNTGLVNPIRFTDKGPIEPIYFAGKATLIVDAKIGSEIIGDGHMWIPEDLSKKGFRVGERVIVCGNVEVYKKSNGQYDYCVSPKRIEHSE